ncbi:MAG: F-box protein [Parachlamydia sp.]|nr:F-box protein [Parachlamydia sp.]
MGVNPDIPNQPINQPTSSTPADPTASSELSDLPSELQAKIFADLSKKDTVSTQVSRQLRDAATDKTRREETAAMKQAVAEIKQHVLNALESSIPLSSDDPKSAEVTKLALGICEDLDRIISSNTLMDSSTISEIRDNIKVKKEALVTSLSKLSENQLKLIKNDLQNQPDYTRSLMDSVIKQIKLNALQSPAENLSSYLETLHFVREYADIDPTLEKSIEFGEQYIKDDHAKRSFFIHLATVLYENKDHARLFGVMLKQESHDQIISLDMLNELLKNDPVHKAEYTQKLTELAANNPTLQELINELNS